jgi:Protein of unknown function (DUF3293)
MSDPDLDAVYRNTDYRVLEPPAEPFVIRIGEPSPEADRVLVICCRKEWAFITACNPGSQRLPDAENAHRLNELQAVCLFHGWLHFVGVGEGRDGTWPPEPSFFVAGIPEQDAIRVARHFGQNAFVAGRAGEPARLVWVETGAKPQTSPP